jgi:hypothetical protein
MAIERGTMADALSSARWSQRGRRCRAVLQAGVTTHDTSRSGRGGGHEAALRHPTSLVSPGTRRSCGRSARRHPGTELGMRIGAHHRDHPGRGPMAGRMWRSRMRLRLQTGSHPQSSERLVVVGIVDRTTTHRHPRARSCRVSHSASITSLNRPSVIFL